MQTRGRFLLGFAGVGVLFGLSLNLGFAGGGARPPARSPYADMYGIAAPGGGTGTGVPARVPTGDDVLIGGVEALAHDIFKGTGGAVEAIKMDLIAPIVLKSKVKEFLADLPIDEAVRKRILRRIETGEFMDKTFPFLLAVKDHYMAPKEATQNNFDRYFRSKFNRAGSPPGTEHSLFKWDLPKETPAGQKSGFHLDPKITADIVAIYDALFLQDPNYRIDAAPQRNRATISRVKPIFKSVLNRLQASMDQSSDNAKGLKKWIDDDAMMETLTLSVVDFVEMEVFKHYSVFARKLARSEALKNWLTTQLDAWLKNPQKNSPRFWEYLEHAQNDRRYGFHIVVDGLQGHLVRALAEGNANSPFIQETLREYRQADQTKPATQNSTPAPKQSTAFLEHFASKGYANANYLAYLRRKFANQPGGFARGGISTTPTISVRNLPVAMMGAPVLGEASIGLPNFHFVDRPEDRAYYFYGNDALLMEKITAKNGAQTMFERLSSLNTFNCNSAHERGAKGTFDGLLNLILGEKVRDFGDVLCANELERRAKVELELQKKRRDLLAKRATLAKYGAKGFGGFMGKLNPIDNPLMTYRRAIQLIAELAEMEDDGMPQYVQYYNPFPDHFAHFTGPFADEILAPSGELNRLDYWLSRMESTYQSAGLLSRTLFGMAGDHGLAPVFHMLNPEVEALGELNLKIRKISADEGGAPILTNPDHPPTNRGYDVIVASTAGGNYMMDFFKDHGAGWIQQPLHADLTHLRTLDGRTIDVIDTLATRLSESLDYLVTRETACDTQGGTYHLVGTRDGKRVDEYVRRVGNRIHYKFSTGNSLLSLHKPSPYDPPLVGRSLDQYQGLLSKCVTAAKEEDPNTWCTDGEWRLLSSFTERPDSVVQIAHLYDSDLPGTINLFPKQGVGYNTSVPGRHAGELFHEKDAFVGFWGNPVRATRRIPAAVNGSVPVTIFEYLTDLSTEQQPKGWGYPTLRRELFGK
ncbi:MAG: hypothetical protein AB7P04_06200 [Bacteriovoracia bacterium]